MKKNKRANFHYALIHALFWTTYCTGTGYLSSCLLSIGYDNGQVGIVIAICGLASAWLQSFLSGKIDKSGKRLLKPVIFFSITTAMILSALELIFPESMPVIGICYGFNIVVLMFTVPLISSMSVCSGAGPVNFGLGRAIGSLVYACGAIVVGRLVAGFGMPVLCIFRIVGYAAFLLAAMTFPIKTLPLQEKTKKDEGFFKRNPGFKTLMVGCVLAYFCQTLTSYFGYQIIASKGGDNAALGISMGLAAFIEVPVMLGFVWLLKYKSAAFWFVLSGFGYAAKAFAFYLAPNVPMYFLAQISQLIGWPLMQVASVKYVSSITKDEDTTRGQAYITLTYSISMVAGSPIGGFVIQNSGVPAMLLIAMLSALLSGVFIFAGIKKRKMS